MDILKLVDALWIGNMFEYKVERKRHHETKRT